jgi:hypothetical protein
MVKRFSASPSPEQPNGGEHVRARSAVRTPSEPNEPNITPLGVFGRSFVRIGQTEAELAKLGSSSVWGMVAKLIEGDPEAEVMFRTPGIQSFRPSGR